MLTNHNPNSIFGWSLQPQSLPLPVSRRGHGAPTVYAFSHSHSVLVTPGGARPNHQMDVLTIPEPGRARGDIARHVTTHLSAPASLT